MEKSTIPNMGLLRSMPFQLTAVCEGAVPRSEAVARVARPDDLMNIVLFLANTSAIDNVTLSVRTCSLSGLFCTPISRSERAALTTTPSTFMVRRVSLSCAHNLAPDRKKTNNMIIKRFTPKMIP